ncbi:serine/threonine-protein phosphatase 2A activator-like [Littorina saxatilis]|uniref:Serine/threonine-protein phosphatase 2A activator n=1 Tax=Littorina saxatilis TaxID=31220 RepID=A0AAN9G4X8_9CAEN
MADSASGVPETTTGVTMATTVLPPLITLVPPKTRAVSTSCSSSESDTQQTVPCKTLPVDVTTHTFKKPEKAISLPEHIPAWEKSEGYHDLMGFILTLNEAVKDKKVTDDVLVSDLTKEILALLDELERWIVDIPPIDQPQRFGNKAFRDWYARLTERSQDVLRKALPEKFHPAVAEMAVYLEESFGNSTRIDYGTGHELAFVAFLCCLCKIAAFGEEDYPALGLKIFNRYIQVARKLQETYRMEPAGSHGVWSLDDYQFLPFLWGSAQLLNNKRILPKSFVKPDIYVTFAKDYLFLAAVNFINTVKTGPFAEHSNQLWNVSGVANWGKVNTGLIKMYKAEVLCKFPVVQHFLFGSLLTMNPVEQQT